jgi:hypothetical protein
VVNINVVNRVTGDESRRDTCTFQQRSGIHVHWRESLMLVPPSPAPSNQDRYPGLSNPFVADGHRAASA